MCRGSAGGRLDVLGGVDSERAHQHAEGALHVRSGRVLGDLEDRLPVDLAADLLNSPKEVQVAVRNKPADPDVMPGIGDKGKLLGSFAQADAILWGLENGVEVEELAARFGQDAVGRIQSLYKLSAPMRQVPYGLVSED